MESESFDELARRHRPALVRAAFRVTRDQDDAHDVAQEALLRAFIHLPSHRSERSLSKWLFAIARNASLDVVRRRRYHALRAHLIGTAQSAGPEDICLRAEDAGRARAALAVLPRRQREALELHYFLDLRYREVAAELGIPIGTVKTLISRGKRRLEDPLLWD